MERFARFMARHHWWVIAFWIILLAALIFLSGRLDHQTRDVFTVPGTESQEALDLTEDDIPAFADPTATVVFHAKSGQVTDEATAQAIGETVANLEKIDHVAEVTDPTGDPYLANNVSKDKTISFVTVSFDVTDFDVLTPETFDEMQKAADPATGAGLEVQYGGEVVDFLNPDTGGLAEYADEISVGLALLILVLSFGSLVFTLMPLTVALVALGTSLSALAVLEHFFTIGTVNPILGTMLGLGVGIDYSLLITNRFRQRLAAGEDPHDAIGRAVATSGKAVLFAGITVSVAASALFIIGVPYVSSLGFTTAMFVLITVAAALTLLPALLGLIGRRIEKLSLPWGKLDQVGKEGVWSRWAGLDARHPRVFLLLPVALLVVLAIPFTSAQLGIIDDGSQPTNLTQRQAYDLLAEGFGPGQNGPLLVVVELPELTTDNEADVLRALEITVPEALRNTEDVSTATEADVSQNKEIGVIEVIPDTGPDDPATTELVEKLRDDVLPDAVKGTTLAQEEVLVGGETAELIDFTDKISAGLPMFVASVLAAAFLLLLVAFRSIVVPLKAMLLTLLSFLAAYGVVVAVFQWGWLRDVIALQQTVPIESFLPLMLFAILFGLSLDYEVFLVSRVREEFDDLDDAGEAVTRGLATTGHVITSAALIMASVFLAFATNPSPTIKQLGFGLAVAILLDALLVRLMIVPSTLHLVKRAAWWFPKWLRWVPRLEIG